MPCISIATQFFLSELLVKYKPKRYLEIWSADGFSLCFISNIVNDWWWYAVWFERWYLNWSHTEQNISLLRHYWLYNFECIYGSFIDRYIDIIWHKFDMIFLDGQKSEYATYLQILVDQDVIGSDTIIVIDDVIKYKDKMSNLYDMISWPERSFDIYPLDDDDGVMVLKFG